MESTWRLIHSNAGDAYWNMAVDEAMFLLFCAGKSSPAIRFYTWDRPSISMGRFQQAANSIDVDLCQKRNIPIVRRPTGGRAVIHGTDLTFSIVNKDGERSVEASYAQVSSVVVDALTSLGVPVRPFGVSSDRRQMGAAPNCFDLHGAFEVALDGRKVLGCAQVRQGINILQQNSLVLEAPASDNLNAFVGRCLPHGTSCIEQYAAGNTVMRAICGRIEQMLGVLLSPTDLTTEENRLAHHLLDEKYSVRDWNLDGRRIVDTQIMSVLY